MFSFEPSRLKIKRAVQHIEDLNALLKTFADSDFYSIHIEKDIKTGTNHLRAEIDTLSFPNNIAALTIGDALHNLRSALDFLYYATVLACGGTPSNWTRFPVRDTREELAACIKSALEHKRISLQIHDLILSTVKPYKAGNYTLWAVDDLNIRDKHQLLIPVLKAMLFQGVRLKDDQHTIIPIDLYVMDESGSMKLRELVDKNLTVQDKGHATPNIFFDIGIPFEGQPVSQTLSGIAVEITRTIEAFEFVLS